MPLLQKAKERGFIPENIFLETVNGSVIGILGIIYSVSFVSLIFSGPLSSFLFPGVIIALLCMVVYSLIIGMRSDFPEAVGIPQGKPSAILSLTVASLAASLAGKGTETSLFITVLAMLGTFTIVSGLTFYFCGKLKLGRFIRFIPFPKFTGMPLRTTSSTLWPSSS